MYRDARVEIEVLQGKDPFIDIQWPRLSRKKPAPFTAEERDRILAWWLDNDCFCYPWVAWQFYTGMRPSETAALTWADVNLEAGTVSISKSRNMGTTAATKTANSERIIPVDEPLLAILKLLPSRELGLEHVLSASVAINVKEMGSAQLEGMLGCAWHRPAQAVLQLSAHGYHRAGEGGAQSQGHC
jgi:integrase